MALQEHLDGSANNTSGAVRGKRANESGTLAERQAMYAKRSNVLGKEGGAAALALPAAEEQAPVFDKVRPHILLLLFTPKPLPVVQFACSVANSAASVRFGHMSGRSGTAHPVAQPLAAFAPQKAMNLMKMMGFKEGSGLGKDGKGISTAIDAVGNMRRTGLGFGSDQSAEAKAAWAPAPDTAVLTNDAPLDAAEVAGWAAAATMVIPSKLIKSKAVPNDDILVELRGAREEYDAAAPAGRKRPCRHVGTCVAPRACDDVAGGRAGWKLASLESAVGALSAAAHAAGDLGTRPYAVDLALRGSGAARYLHTAPVWGGAGGGGACLPTPQAEALALEAPSWSLLPGAEALVGAADDGAALLAALTSDSSRAVAAAAAAALPALVIGDLSSVKRAALGAPRLGALEREFGPVYRRRVVWEAATGLAALPPGGCLFLRLGDCLTSFSTSLLYLLHRCFRKLLLLKTFAACACSPERYVVCARRRLLRCFETVLFVSVPDARCD